MCPPRVLNLELMTQRSRGGRFSMETVGMVTSIKGGKWHRASYDNCQCPLATNIKCLSLRRVWLFATPWTVVHQAPLSTEFSRQEYWNGLPFPPPGDLPDPRIKPKPPALQADSLLSEPPRKLQHQGPHLQLNRLSSSLIAVSPKSLQLCPTLCDPIDSSPPGSPVPGILQARTLEWVAISLSNAWKWKVKVKSLSRVRPSATPWPAAHQASPSMGFSRQEYWSGVPLPSLHCSEGVCKSQRTTECLSKRILGKKQKTKPVVGFGLWLIR